jgi:hypothetical protein
VRYAGTAMTRAATTPLCRTPSCRGPYPVADAFVCTNCTAELRTALRSIPEIMAELLVNMTRQDVADPQPGGRSDEPPLLYRPEATEAGRDLHAVLTTWTAHLLESRGLAWEDVLPRKRPQGAPYGPLRAPVPGAYTYPPPETATNPSNRRDAARLPSGDTAELARWLDRHLETVRADEAGGELVDEVVDAVARCEHAIDRAPARIYLGACGCSTPLEPQVDLYAHPDSAFVTCRACEAVYNVTERRAWLLEQSQGLLVTAELASRALPGLVGVTITPEIIRSLHRNHGLARHRPSAGDPHRRWRYRVGDIVSTIAELQARRSSAAVDSRVRPPIEALPPELQVAVVAVSAAARRRAATSGLLGRDVRPT